MTHKPFRWIAAALACAALTLPAVPCFAAADDAASLKARYGQLQGELAHTTFGEPIHIDSAQQGDHLQGDVYALLPHSFEHVRQALKDPQDWCDVLILPFNTRQCVAQGSTLHVRIGRKPDQPADEAYPIDFSLQPAVSQPGYFETHLSAGQGPVGTRDYRITVAAVPVDNGRTFLHLAYSYGYGASGRFAMNMYLATAGASKVGFTVTGRDANGQPAYIGGVRGAIERNVMRYYLAINAHLVAAGAPAAQRKQKRIETWFDSSERYPRQLHEMDRAQYIALKRESGTQQAMRQSPQPSMPQ